MPAKVPPERVAAAIKLLASYVPAVEAERELADLFGVSPRVARRAVAEARKLLHESVIVDRDAARARIRAGVELVLRDALTKLSRGFHKVALQAFEVLVQLDGLAEAQRVAVEHFAADAPVLGKRALAERLAELEQRAKAEGSGDGN